MSCFVQQSETQRYSIYNDIKEEKKQHIVTIDKLELENIWLNDCNSCSIIKIVGYKYTVDRLILTSTL